MSEDRGEGGHDVGNRGTLYLIPSGSETRLVGGGGSTLILRQATQTLYYLLLTLFQRARILDRMGETLVYDAQPEASSSKGRIAVDMDDVLW